MSEHDPLCSRASTSIPVDRYCDCSLIHQAEQRGRALELERVLTEIDALKGNVALGSKPGYRQGFVGCWHLVRGIIVRERKTPS
jgi:hypothetical protein